MLYKKTSIIIVSYKALNYLQQCIESIRANTTIPYELIIVDNNSGEPTTRYLLAQRDIKLVLNKQNVLLTPAQSQALKLVDKDSHYVLFLNPDMRILRPDWLQLMIDRMESQEKVGIVGPIYNVQAIGPLFGNIDMACLLARTILLHDTGGLNTNFPWNGAGFILTVDAWSHGWRYKHLKWPKIIKHYGAKSRSFNKIPNTKIDQRAEILKRGLKPSWSLVYFLRQFFQRPDLIWKSIKLKYL
ncbi:glycosyltransferase [candidate division KSB1 bacterium]|nr:glycosyltransferase [candidate division KSB1 bacterium]RQW00610.1 MAG: glycosyltransferase [candidate division KSB1 bacterium]